jgi:hypothetical protein
MKRMILASLAALALSAASGAANADVIDFDALAGGDAGNPLALAGATFTALDGGFNMIGSSGGLCAAPTNDNSVAVCTKDVQVDFDVASSDVSFLFFGNNNKTVGADIGDVQVFNGAVLLGVADVLVVDAVGGKDLLDLSAYGSITRLVISSTDFGGVLYDDFTFTPGGGAVPEPSTWAVMLLGFGLTGAMVRRRRPAAA